MLGRSQPVISRALQKLEAELGYPLFNRIGPRVTPTERGFQFYEEVDRTLLSLRQLGTRAKKSPRAWNNLCKWPPHRRYRPVCYRPSCIT